MKRVCLDLSKYPIGILILLTILSCSVRAQQSAIEPASGTGPETTTTKTEKADTVKPDPDPYRTYVFPTQRERFDRYVKDTVGPLSLTRSAASAGLDQWRDSPEEWQQGMKGTADVTLQGSAATWSNIQ